MKRYILIVINTFIGISLLGQNLVINPNFEHVFREPKHISELGFANSWCSPNMGTPDLLSVLSKKKDIQIPINTWGIQKSFSGNHYAGIYVSQGAVLEPNIIEFLQGKLSKMLEIDKIYRIEFYYSLADKSHYSGNSIGVYMSNKRLAPIDGFPKKFKYSLSVSNKDDLENKDKWIKFSQLYCAKGDEIHIIIGEMEREKKSRKKRVANHFSYYYIDNVSVTLVDTVFSTIEDTILGVELNKPLVLQNVLFKSNSSILEGNSFLELDKLFKKIMGLKGLNKIEISGYTDNIGSEEENLALSEARAKSVVDYLIAKGIEKERIKHKGYGSTMPITTNETEEGRERNRRVELIIN